MRFKFKRDRPTILIRASQKANRFHGIKSRGNWRDKLIHIRSGTEIKKNYIRGNWSVEDFRDSYFAYFLPEALHRLLRTRALTRIVPTPSTGLHVRTHLSTLHHIVSMTRADGPSKTVRRTRTDFVNMHVRPTNLSARCCKCLPSSITAVILRNVCVCVCVCIVLKYIINF